MEMRSVGGALIRPGQLLMDRASLPAAAPWTQAVSESDGVCVVRLSPGVDPCELSAELRGKGVRASPNHVLCGQPLFFGGPASRPFPTPPVPFRAAGSRSDVVVALLDTGVAGHPWWADSDWYARTGPEDADATQGQQAGHGTFVAGLLTRFAPGAALRVGRVLDGDGITDEATVVRALCRLRERPPHVLNLSFGGHTYDDLPPPLLSDAVAGLPGTVTVACAGNAASDRPFWPAALPSVIGVAALDAAQQQRAAYSGYGAWVDACTRGDWLSSSYLDAGDFGGYATWCGTSFAAATVSGIIAGAAAKEPAKQVVKRMLEAEGTRQIPDLGVLVPASL